MKTQFRAIALALAVLMSHASLAGETVPINATFGIQWTPVDWTNPSDRVTESLGAAGLPNGGPPLDVVGGEGRFLGATGALTIRSRVLFSLPVGTFAVKGVIRTLD
jgi:hypothetical protein